MKPPAETYTQSHCWKTIGIFGDRSCEVLPHHVHCRNCPTYQLAGRQLLDRPMSEDYRREITNKLAAQHRPRQIQTLRLMIFRVADVWLALPSACLEQTLSPVPTSSVPQRSNRHFLGLVNAHGELQLCFTLRHLIQTDLTTETSASSAVRIFPRLLVLKLHGQRWVIHADEVMGVIEYPSASLQNLPANLSQSKPQLMTALFEFEGQRISLIDEERLALQLQNALA